MPISDPVHGYSGSLLRLTPAEISMLYWALAASALLLSIERLTYYGVSHHPEKWRRLCAVFHCHAPVGALHKLFYVFKAIQLSVFFGWCILFSETLLPWPTASLPAMSAGILCILFGLVLNASVFYRLGSVGVFYGQQMGHSLPWVQGFPFSLFRHPQYLGTLVSIWGFFLVMRHPHPDWFYLPLLQTFYYAWGAYHEP